MHFGLSFHDLTSQHWLADREDKKENTGCVAAGLLDMNSDFGLQSPRRVHFVGILRLVALPEI
jgi:hypothetical protein